MFKIEFETDSDAFQLYEDSELDNIFRRIRNARELGKTSGVLKDINGNTVGSWSTSES